MHNNKKLNDPSHYLKINQEQLRPSKTYSYAVFCYHFSSSKKKKKKTEEKKVKKCNYLLVILFFSSVRLVH